MQRAIATALALLVACSRAPPAASDPYAGALRAAAERGLSASRRLDEGCGKDRDAYLEVRRSLLASMKAWRMAVPSAANVAFGPPEPKDEAPGAIGELDRAMGGPDCAAIRRAARTMASAFDTGTAELTRTPIPASLTAQALSDGAYELGQAIAESTAYVPDAEDAAFADVLGLLSGLEMGLSALHVDAADALAPFARIKAARSLADLRDRASLVRATGVLGARIRAAVGGKPPLVPATPTEEISALTLPRPAAPVDPARAALGAKLFSDPRLSRNGVRSCTSCHDPSKAYQDGLAVPASLVPGTPLKRNTPTLLYAPLAASFTWDGRIASADRQALSVIHTEAEMGLTDDELTRLLAADATYARAFRDAFARDVTPDDVGSALSAFESSALIGDAAPIDDFGRRGDLSDDARAGFDVFAGKGRCARCHVPPVWGGTRPPDFRAAIYSVLGVPTIAGGHELDSDPGRGAISHIWADAHAFKVPTVRNATWTAPYFHNGSLPTLEAVVDFYDRGGGRGIGIHVPDQDPDVRPLGLTPEEKRVLLVFLRDAVTDPESNVRRPPLSN
jgi:cytochrome c peroxidase